MGHPKSLLKHLHKASLNADNLISLHRYYHLDLQTLPKAHVEVFIDYYLRHIKILLKIYG